MAPYVLIAAFVSLVAGSDLIADAELEKALFADVEADTCITEACGTDKDAALSLLQTSASLHQKRRHSMSTISRHAVDADTHSPSQKPARMQTTLLKNTQAKKGESLNAVPITLLQTDSITEDAPEEDGEQAAESDDYSGAAEAQTDPQDMPTPRTAATAPAIDAESSGESDTLAVADDEDQQQEHMSAKGTSDRPSAARAAGDVREEKLSSSHAAPARANEATQLDTTTSFTEDDANLDVAPSSEDSESSNQTGSSLQIGLEAGTTMDRAEETQVGVGRSEGATQTDAEGEHRQDVSAETGPRSERSDEDGKEIEELSKEVASLDREVKAAEQALQEKKDTEMSAVDPLTDLGKIEKSSKDVRGDFEEDVEQNTGAVTIDGQIEAQEMSELQQTVADISGESIEHATDSGKELPYHRRRSESMLATAWQAAIHSLDDVTETVSFVEGCLALALILLVTFAAFWFWAPDRTEEPQEDPPTSERQLVATAPFWTAGDISEKLPAGTGYDCMLSKPLTSGQMVRLEVRIEGSTDGSVLLSPLKQHQCVRFSAAVYCQERDGMRSHPLALHSGSINFVVSLVDSPSTRIDIVGDDVALFDMKNGYCSKTHTLATAPDRWKEFAVAWQIGTNGRMARSGQCGLGNEEALEFRESALIIGSHVTVLGELRRDAIGRLQLHPWHEETRSSFEPWRLSWERSGCENAGEVAKAKSPAALNKVLATDDPKLLRPSYQRFFLASVQSMYAFGHILTNLAAFTQQPAAKPEPEALISSLISPPILNLSTAGASIDASGQEAKVASSSIIIQKSNEGLKIPGAFSV